MRRTAMWVLLLAAAFLIAAACGDDETDADVAEPAPVAAPADLTGVAVQDIRIAAAVHEALGSPPSP